jgi:hypothetical protein
MEKRSDKGVRIGLIGVALLLISYVRLFGFRFMSPEWSIAILILSALAVMAFVAAGRLSNKWWYCGTLFGILSAFFVFAFAWG